MRGSGRGGLGEALHTALLHAVRMYNGVIRRRWTPPAGADDPLFREVLRHSREPSDISDHLPVLFLEAISARPSLIVELGVRDGNSTFVLERVARLAGADLVSVDVEECSGLSDYQRWHFVQEDDVQFGARFPAWCKERGLPPKVDFLFIDTLHSYEHTREELRAWLPHLSPHGKAAFHDSNQRRIYRRRDGTLGVSRQNRRGVLDAIQEWVGGSFDESRAFETVSGGFLIRHIPECNGLTVMERHPALDPARSSGAS